MTNIKIVTNGEEKILSLPYPCDTGFSNLERWVRFMCRLNYNGSYIDMYIASFLEPGIKAPTQKQLDYFI